MAELTPEEKEAYRAELRRRVQFSLMESQRAAERAAMTHQRRPDEPVSNVPTAMMMTSDGMRPVPPALRMLMAAGAGTQDILANVGEMTGMISPEQYRETREANLPFRQQSPVGAFIGETATTSLPSMAVGGPAATLGRFAGINPAFTRSVTESGLSGALTSEPEKRREGAFYGATTGLAVPLAGGATSRMVRGLDMTPSARMLTQRGVTLTPGQLDPTSNWAMLEESMQRFPLVGPKVTYARQRGMTEAQTLVAQEAAPPGYTVTPTDNVNELADQVVNAYNEAYKIGKGYPMRPVIMQAGRDTPLSSALRVPSNAVAGDEAIQYADKFLKEQLSFIQKKGKQLTSDDLFQVRSNIRKEIRDINKSQQAPFKAADLLEAAENRLEAAIQSQLPDDVLAAVSAIDAQYGKYKTFERAINRAADRQEGFTPAQFAQSIRETTSSPMTYATGGGRMRELSQAFSETFPGRQPQTGASLVSTPFAAGAAVLGLPAYGLPLTRADAPLYSGVRRLVGGGTQAQRSVQDAVAEFERRFGRRLSPQERQNLISVIRSGAGVYGAQERPIEGAFTGSSGGLLE